MSPTGVVCTTVCRLFGLSGGRERIAATFWLLEAPDSLAEQSHREPDGTGLGAFLTDGRPYLAKQPVAAWADRAFAREARTVHSRTFVAHIRYASTGAVAPQNTHPFEQCGRLFAHNGVIGEIDRLEQALGSERALVRGETDSERFFALISHEMERTRDIGSAIASAAQWIAGNLPVFALNCILITPTDLWALRYPDVHELYFLERAAGGSGEPAHLDHRGSAGEMHVQSAHLAAHPAVVVASEPLDHDPGWRPLGSGELLHVDAGLHINIARVVDSPPARALTLAELDPRAAASQQVTGGGT